VAALRRGLPVIAALLAMSLVAEPALSDRAFDVSLPIGIGWHGRADGAGYDGAFHLGVAGGFSARETLGWPLRTEVMLSTSTDGPPWGKGVDAVSVSRLDVDFAFFSGAGWTLLDEGQRALGVEALVGPRVRFTEVSAHVYAVTERHLGLALAAKGLAGVFSTIGPVRLGLRLGLTAPWDRTIELWLVSGYTF